MARAAESQPGGITHILRVTYEDLLRDDFLDASNQIDIALVEPGQALDLVVMWHVANFNVNTLAFDVGYTIGDPDDLIDAYDLTSGGESTVAYSPSDFTGGYSNGTPATSPDTIGTQIVAEFTGDVTGITAGELVIGVRVCSIL